MENKDTKLQEDIDWEQRKLCRDESCIGVIGKDGRCKECGLPYEAGSAGENRETAAAADFEETGTEAEFETEAEAGAVKSEADLEWERRTLCSDESCIGVIGPDGRCKECGKPYEA